MARRGLRYLAKRIRQIAILTIGSAIFLGLCFASLTQAKNGNIPEGQDIENRAASPTKIMQILMTPAGSPVDGCLLPVKLPDPERCKPFFNVDDEDVLENLLQNYTSCLDGHTFYYDFSNQPVITLNRPLKIYGRTEEPLTIKGLKLAPGKDFPKGSPAIAVFGKTIRLKDIQLDGFETGILFASEDGQKNKLIGGEINGSGKSDRAILACHASPSVDGTIITGYAEKVSVIK